MISARRQPATIAEALDQQRVARVHRNPLRGWWLRNRAIVAVIAGIVAIILGLWGFSRSNADVHGWSDRFYKTFRLFSFNGDEANDNWQLEIARVLAPLVVGYAAIRALIALFHHQALLMRVRFFARRHVVIVGLGKRGFLLAKALDEAHIQVVVIDRDGSNRSMAGCRERGIPVIVGDATDPEVLMQARCDRALHIFACCATDATNLDVLAACSVLVTDSGWLPSMAHVLIETRPLWVHLQTASINAGNNEALRVDFASVPELVARALVGASLEIWEPGQEEACAIVANASTETGRRTAIQAVRTAMTATTEIRLTLIGDTAEEDEKALRSDAPWLERTATVTAEAFDASGDGAGPLPIPRDASVVFICDADEAIGLAQGMALAEHLPDAVPIIVNVDDDRLPESLAAADITLGQVKPVGGMQRVLGPHLLLDTITEALARARHESYVRFEHAEGRGDADNPSLAPWDELPESLKESNRQFADHIGKKVKEFGGKIVPIQPGQVEAISLVLPPERLEELAIEEHERWVAGRLSDGWKPTTGEKDVHRKLHPLLIPWDELEEKERAKDRESIRELPALLASAGYTVEFEAGHAGERLVAPSAEQAA